MNMNSGVQNLVISLGVMQGTQFAVNPLNLQTANLVVAPNLVARKIPFDEPDVLLYVRIGYVVSQIAILSVYYYISYKVLDVFPLLFLVTCACCVWLIVIFYRSGKRTIRLC